MIKRIIYFFLFVVCGILAHGVGNRMILSSINEVATQLICVGLVSTMTILIIRLIKDYSWNKRRRYWNVVKRYGGGVF